MTIRSFHNLDAAWSVALAEVMNSHDHEFKSRAGQCREILGYTFRLTDPRNCMITNAGRKWKSWYAGAELLWYLGRYDDVKLLEPFAPRYREFASPGTDRANGAYGARWVSHMFGDQMEQVIRLLREKPETRQAVVQHWHHCDLVSAIGALHPDLPCTLSMIFSVRDHRLHLQVNMRSNDLWLGTPYDVFCFCSIQLLVARACGYKVGHYTHMVNSMHIYERNFEKATQCISEHVTPRPLDIGSSHLELDAPEFDHDSLRTKLLDDVVNSPFNPHDTRYMGVHSLLFDLAMLCHMKKTGLSSPPLHLFNPQLLEFT